MKREFLGIDIENPLMLTEGPLSGNEELIREASDAGVGLVFTKGIRPEPISSPVPFMGIYGKSLMNADWSCIGLEAWKGVFERIGSELPVVASIAKNYVTPSTAVEMAEILQRTGARIISFVDYNPEQLIAAVKMARPRIKVPLMVKLPPFLPELEDVLRDLINAGVDGIAAMDSIGPVLSIDVETGESLLGSADGSGYLSGEAILPVTLKYIYEISRYVDVPVVGVGGVSNGDSALKMMMAGATGVGMMTQPMLKGWRVYTDVLEGIRSYMERKGISSLEEIRGLAHTKNQHKEISENFRAEIDAGLCSNCGRCRKICFNGAILLAEGSHRVDTLRCTGCGLCSGVCPERAISYLQPARGQK